MALNPLNSNNLEQLAFKELTNELNVFAQCQNEHDFKNDLISTSIVGGERDELGQVDCL